MPVHEFEVDAYRKEGHEVIVLPDEIRGNIARVRNWIRDQFAGEELLIIGDDIRKVQEYRCNKDGEFYRNWLTGDELLEFIEFGFRMAREWGVRLWGVNSTFDKQSYREFQPFSTLSYISASWHGFLDQAEPDTHISLEICPPPTPLVPKCGVYVVFRGFHVG